MARYHLYWATKFADELNITDPDWFQEYKKRLQIKNEELANDGKGLINKCICFFRRTRDFLAR